PAGLDVRQEAREGETGPLDAAPRDRPRETRLARHDAQLELLERRRAEDLRRQVRRLRRGAGPGPPHAAPRDPAVRAVSRRRSAEVAASRSSMTPGVRRIREMRASAWRCAADAAAGDTTRKIRCTGMPSAAPKGIGSAVVAIAATTSAMPDSLQCGIAMP